jgi:biotin-(acetyl-CoA carboxylase) ligase
VDTGSETYIGTTSGLTKEGLLQVEKEDGAVVTVIAGDVTELR